MSFTIKGKYTDAEIKIDKIEENCYKQINHIVNQSSFTTPIKIMPDCHAGKGICIGFTMKLTDKLAPTVVGVDIGCGVTSYNLGIPERELNLFKIEKDIRNKIPMGANHRHDNLINFERDFPWKKVTDLIQKNIDKNFKIFNYEYFYENIIKKFLCRQNVIENSIGSLGGGNHFIEMGKDEDNNIWITVHSGSRNLGQQICQYHEKVAKNIVTDREYKLYQIELDKAKNHNNKSEINDKIKELKKKFGRNDSRNQKIHYLSGDELKEYLIDMTFGQIYAEYNRDVMLKIICDIIGVQINKKRIVTSTHNYIDFRDMIIRKGAIRAYKNEKLIIPWNMRDGLIIGEGLSNQDWNYSAPHGAGRILSRTAARNELQLEEFVKEMQGICTTSVCKSTLDESPMAYKDSELIENSIGETVKILTKVKPIMNIKDK